MSEFFLELFSEEIPANLQINARKNLLQNFENLLNENDISKKSKLKVISTPNRLVINIEKIKNIIVKKSEEISGPSVEAPKKALEGFIRSNKTLLCCLCIYIICWRTSNHRRQTFICV